MNIEKILTIGDPRSPDPAAGNLSRTTGERLTASDIMTALGWLQMYEPFGLSLMLAKYRKDPAEYEKALAMLCEHAASRRPRTVDSYLVNMLAKAALNDYTRTADTPGARCKQCKGRGIIYAVPVRTCTACRGKGIKLAHTTPLKNAAQTLVEGITDAIWYRYYLPFYRRLVAVCYAEAEAAIRECKKA